MASPPVMVKRRIRLNTTSPDQIDTPTTGGMDPKRELGEQSKANLVNAVPPLGCM
jgi:hypothetical protein